MYSSRFPLVSFTYFFCVEMAAKDRQREAIILRSILSPRTPNLFYKCVKNPFNQHLDLFIAGYWLESCTERTKTIHWEVSFVSLALGKMETVVEKWLNYSTSMARKILDIARPHLIIEKKGLQMASSFDRAITSGNLSRRLISHFSEIQVKKKGKQYVGRTVEPKRPQRLDIDGGATSSPNPTLAEKKHLGFNFDLSSSLEAKKQLPRVVINCSSDNRSL